MTEEIRKIIVEGKNNKDKVKDQKYGKLYAKALENTNEAIKRIWKRVIEEWQEYENETALLEVVIKYYIPESEKKFYEEDRNLAKQYNLEDKNDQLIYIDLDYMNKNSTSENYNLVVLQTLLKKLAEDGLSLYYNTFAEAFVIRNTVAEINKIVDVNTKKLQNK